MLILKAFVVCLLVIVFVVLFVEHEDAEHR